MGNPGPHDADYGPWPRPAGGGLAGNPRHWKARNPRESATSRLRASSDSRRSDTTYCDIMSCAVDAFVNRGDVVPGLALTLPTFLGEEPYLKKVSVRERKPATGILFIVTLGLEE